MKNKLKIIIPLVLVTLIMIIVLILAVVMRAGRYTDSSAYSEIFEKGTFKILKVEEPTVKEDLLTVNEYSRPGDKIEEVNSIVIHYTANPGTSAENNRSYFEGLMESHLTYASAHYIVGLEGEIIQCLPLDEIAYASNGRNNDTIAIECCHEDETGEFNDTTYDSLVELTAWLCGEYQINPDDLLRHYDVSGKECPRYFVENEDAWTDFKQDVADYIKENGE